MTKERRRKTRISYDGPVIVSWEDRGEPRYARGRCIDVSESGLRLEVPVSIPVRTEVSVNAERIQVSGQARIQHLARCGAKYRIGVALSHPVKPSLLAVLREPAALVV